MVCKDRSKVIQKFTIRHRSYYYLKEIRIFSLQNAPFVPVCRQNTRKWILKWNGYSNFLNFKLALNMRHPVMPKIELWNGEELFPPRIKQCSALRCIITVFIIK
ncbi:hypothetical protein Bhyg_14537 [Pseudolycoriella hygida]|uniref:Uncharacterized protein n=1 Tax=Pseudolycoriella hygida TaxID=35572 RepID=A0A9Q0RXD5_9DIPT|nr:hypothetical protein Bhyg_14537 [Pseudolycoriella hygida]